jgi:hypothetical protein
VHEQLLLSMHSHPRKIGSDGCALILVSVANHASFGKQRLATRRISLRVR